MSAIQELHEANGTTPQKGTELLQKTEVPNTPFTIVGNDEDGFIITMGVMRLTDKKTFDECMTLIENKNYDLIVTMINGMIIHYDQVKDQLKVKQAVEKAYNIKK